MQLLTGPAGSGKTALILDRLREALRSGDGGVRLLVPTATMARHLQNLVAREGFVFRRSLIQTLSQFVEPWAGPLAQVPDAVLYLIVDEGARRVNRPEFARVAHLPGFCASLARTILEFSSAGCDSARLAAALPAAPLSEAFLAVYREVDRELERRGLALRARRLAAAAERIRKDGLGGIRTIWLDGFHALPDPELDVIEALGRHADVTLTLADADVRPRLHTMGFAELRTARPRSSPAVALVRAPGVEREVEEIARRILQQAASGRPFREIGIIVRPAETYVPILRTTLERFGIPARFYFDSDLAQHAAIRFLTGVVDAMLGGWEHAETLAALRLAPRWADSNAMDRFDFAVREQMPNSGLSELRSLLVGQEGTEKLIHKLDSLAATEEWRSYSLAPNDWAARFATLRNQFRPARPTDATHEAVLLWRSQAAALDLFDEALAEAALALDPARAIALPEFWRAVKSVLRLKPLRLADPRRNVVHVLSAPEARQWVLPVVFVCGMVEKQFPRFHRQDPFFPDAARCTLNAAGIHVRTAAEFEREEQALFESAMTRSTMLVTLSYPEFDARGERNLPSIFLESVLAVAEESRLVRPCARAAIPMRAPRPIQSPALLDAIARRTARLSPTGMESFLQCPFQYFGGRTLRLRQPPAAPEKRLDFLTQGNIVHEVLARWWETGGDIEALFESVFARVAEEKRIPEGYHVERLRNSMIHDLRVFAQDQQWPRAQFQSRMEEKFEFPLEDGVVISGKIDRIDVRPDGAAWVIDYKYSGAQRTRGRLVDGNLLQAPLYQMAVERAFGYRPAGMYYLGLKGGVLYAGWSGEQLEGMPDNAAPVPAGWLALAEQRARGVLRDIRAGRIAAAPADVENCRFCDFRDVCRVRTSGTVAIGEGA